MKKLILMLVFAMVLNVTFAMKTNLFDALLSIEQVEPEPKKEVKKEVKKMVWIEDNGVKKELSSGDMIFINEEGDTTKPKCKDVRVEKEIENGKEKTRVWINGQELDENSAEFKQYGNKENGESNIKTISSSDGKKVIIMKSEIREDVRVETEDGEEVQVDVTDGTDGNQKVIIKTKSKDGTETVKEMIIDSGEGEEVINDGKTKIIIKTQKEMNFDFEGINPDDIEKVDVIKTDDVKKIIILLKNGKKIEKIITDKE